MPLNEGEDEDKDKNKKDDQKRRRRRRTRRTTTTTTKTKQEKMLKQLRWMQERTKTKTKTKRDDDQKGRRRRRRTTITTTRRGFDDPPCDWVTQFSWKTTYTSYPPHKVRKVNGSELLATALRVLAGNPSWIQNLLITNYDFWHLTRIQQSHFTIPQSACHGKCTTIS